jgi:Flp pilus assembly protein TadG
MSLLKLRRLIRPDSQRGQTLVIFAAGFTVLIGFASLAIDGSHRYLARLEAQSAADTAALGAARVLAGYGRPLTAAPGSGVAEIHAANDISRTNGFDTIYNTACESRTATQYKTTWFDDSPTGCAADANTALMIEFAVPPNVPASSMPARCKVYKYNCASLKINLRVFNYFGSTTGPPSAFEAVQAIGFGQPPVPLSTAPTPTGVYLYQPQSGCDVNEQQCFNESSAPSRALMSCAGTSNCPTFWAKPNTKPVISSYDGALFGGTNHAAGLISNGDMVLQSDTTICDSYGGATCAAATSTGSSGFELSSGGKLYCSAFAGGGSANGLTGCTATGPGGSALGKVYGSEAAYTSESWTPNVSNQGLPDCAAGLILNGDTVAASFTGATHNAACEPSSNEPYNLVPGIYQYIVVNHGAYTFNPGLFDITGSAPVNTAAGTPDGGGNGCGGDGSDCSGSGCDRSGNYNCNGGDNRGGGGGGGGGGSNTALANGIDHSQETATADFDLCTGATPTSCPTLTAGVWFGHGSLGYASGAATDVGSCAAGSSSGAFIGGGGDATVIQGAGVVFRLRSTAGGFVSTSEVKEINLTPPGPNSLPAVLPDGTPLLIDLENSKFIHLDAAGTAGPSSFTGVLYQTQSAVGGGLEVDPSMAGSSGGNAAIVGQVRAYSLTVFGGSGPAVDFSQGYGQSSSPTIVSTARNEPEIVGSPAPKVTAGPTASTETLTVSFQDEWALDGYDIYARVNSNPPVFFSKNIWNPVPGSGQSIPPANNNPGYAYPAAPAASQDPGNKYTHNTVGGRPDWTTTGTDPYVGNYTYEVSGNWIWGRQSNLSGARTATNQATIAFTFPTPPGQTASLILYMSDGDRCGDFAEFGGTFNNIGQPSPALQSAGNVSIEQ